MQPGEFEKVAVIGAGVMGRGIGEVIAIAGYSVYLYDIEKDILEEARKAIEGSLAKLQEKDRISEEEVNKTLDRITTTIDLRKAASEADFAVEAAPEKMELKKDIFSDLDNYTPTRAILASNTSSLSITEIATATERPDKVVGMHWFNPPVLMDLVEVTYGEKTSNETAETTYKFIEEMGKTPIYCRKDIRRFVVNNVLDPFMIEPMWMLSRGEAEIREIDAAMVHRRGYSMGPFELADFVGLDISYSIKEEAGEPIPPVMKEKVKKEELGRKTGKGFYDYEESEGVDFKKGQGEEFDTFHIESMMFNEVARVIQMGAAAAEEIDTGMKLGADFPEGPCRRADKVGLDNVFEELEELYGRYGEKRYKPVEWLREKVKAGETGKEASSGFYGYGKAADAP